MFADLRLTVVSALILLSCYALPSSKAQNINYNNVCLLINSDEFIASENSCTDYYSCLNGVATLHTCPSGLYFIKDSQQCGPPIDANCLAPGQQTCTGVNVGTWIQAPGSCSGFFYCGANGPLRGSCPLGENFNPFSQSCVYASEYPCTDAGNGDNINDPGNTGINLCTLMPNNVFFGSASSCSDWHVCKKNVLTTGTCPNGYNFNPSINKCDYASNVKCTQVTNDPSLTNSPNDGGACTTPNMQKPASQCNAYYICNGANYRLTICPRGEYYDTVSQTCVNRMYARNNCDRCQGTTASFVNMYSSQNCQGYLYCQNGVEKGSGYCPAGSNFDELAGACVTGPSPNYGCCNPSFYNPSTNIPPPNGPPATTTTTTTKAPTTTTTTKAPTTTTTTKAPTTTTTTKAPTTTTTTKAPTN